MTVFHTQAVADRVTSCAHRDYVCCRRGLCVGECPGSGKVSAAQYHSSGWSTNCWRQELGRLKKDLPLRRPGLPAAQTTNGLDC